MDPTDAALLRTGTADSFSELYERHAEAVLVFFMRRVGCAETAADLTAETFAAAFDSRHRFRDVGAPGRAWVFTIARRQLGRFVRREKVADRARRRLGIEPLDLTPVGPVCGRARSARSPAGGSSSGAAREHRRAPGRRSR